jgi:pimeloyl-ACP methyl ester carboxylesterase
MARHRCFALAVLAALLLVPAASAKAPAGDAFYTPPSPVPGKAHGDLIWSRAEDAPSNMRLAGASQNLLVLYRSTGIGGTAVADSGAVAIPKGKPPKGGWPVLTWAHGTTGLADQCAPTRMARQTDAYTTDLRSQFAAYLKAGYAVAAADYEGLGTPGVHPYLIGSSEGHAVLDIVRAARKIDKRIGRSVAIMGHSQGGHAALWAAALAPKYTPELTLRATVAFAPASHIKDQANLLDVLTQPSPLSGLVASIFRGADVAYPSLQVPSLLSDRALALYPSVDDKCLGDLYAGDSWGGLAPSEILKSGVDRAPLLDAADKSDPENLTIKTPIEILQGGSDGTVIPLFTDQLVNELGQKGAKVTYKKYPGVDHSPVVRAAGKDARAFLKKKVGR